MTSSPGSIPSPGTGLPGPDGTVPGAGPVAGGRPLTRRERRELERAQEARTHAWPGATRQPSVQTVVHPEPPASTAASPAAPAGAWTQGPSAPDEPPEVSEPPGASEPLEAEAGYEPVPDEDPALALAQAVPTRRRRRRPRGLFLLSLLTVLAVAIVLVPVYLYRTYGHTDARASATVPPTTVPANAPIDSALEVAGHIGSVPVVTLRGVLTPPETLLTDVVLQGQGRTVSAGDGVVLSVSTFSGLDRTNTTPGTNGKRLFWGLLDAERMGEAVASAVAGQTEGSRVVLRAPDSDEQGRTITEITVIDILPTTADGQQVEPTAGMPTFALAEDGTATVGVEGLSAPTTSAAATLVMGSGAQVTAKDTVIARYQIVPWTGGSTHSTYGWTTAPGVINMTDTLTGISQNLVDVKVGSRVVLALPADQARGDSPVAVVIDILAVEPGEAVAEDPSAPSDQTPFVVEVPTQVPAQ